jgi:hypothetical protein
VDKLAPEVGDTVKAPGDGGVLLLIWTVLTDLRASEDTFTKEHVSAKVSCALDGSREGPITRFSRVEDPKSEDAGTAVRVAVSAMEDKESEDGTVVVESSKDHTQRIGMLSSSTEAKTDILELTEIWVSEAGEENEIVTLGPSLLIK